MPGEKDFFQSTAHHPRRRGLQMYLRVAVNVNQVDPFGGATDSCDVDGSGGAITPVAGPAIVAIVGYIDVAGPGAIIQKGSPGKPAVVGPAIAAIVGCVEVAGAGAVIQAGSPGELVSQ